MRPGAWLMLIGLLLAAPAASGEGAPREGIWLRGRGADVWIEGDAPRASRRRESIRVLEHLEARHHRAPGEHAYSPRFYVPVRGYRLYPLPRSLHRPPWGYSVYGYPPYGDPVYRHPSYARFGYGHWPGRHGGWQRPTRRRHLHHGDASSYGLPAYRRPGPYGGGGRSGGVVLRGGAWRRAR